VFNVVTSYHEASLRAYQFMIEGLLDVYQALQKMHIGFHLTTGNPETVFKSYIDQLHALFVDKGYLKTPRLWRQNLLDMLPKDVRFVEVDTNVLVPVSFVSQKVEYGAYTIRPKIHKLKDEFFDLSHPPLYEGKHLDNQLAFDLTHPSSFIQSLPINHDIFISKYFMGGQEEAKRRLKHFLDKKITLYPERNEPHLQITSTLSPYIHFGHISTQRIMLETEECLKLDKINQEAYDAFFEQVIVRRELAHNFVYYQHAYDQFESMTEPWAYLTMTEHANDVKTHIYDMKELVSCQTHDVYFNAAMKEMVLTGYMHNYMRMYWAKKIIEWSKTFKEAYETTLALNNTYFLDGRDPVSYASVAWNYGKHDRAWNERDIFGKLRYMNASGLERKFDMKAYIRYVEQL
jgi:deoxyribodipyrimidine photo-lyase